MTTNDKQTTDERSEAASPTLDGSHGSDSDSPTGKFERLPAGLRERLASRREFLSDSAKVGGTFALLSAGGGVASAQTGGDDAGDGDDGDGSDEGDDGEAVDQPEGFSAEVVAPYGTFPDDVGLALGVTFEDGTDESAFVRDASTLVVASVSLDPGGTSGWHTHPGPVVVNVTAGEIEVVFADDCVSHTYAAGEAFVDTGGHAEVARNPSDTEQAEAYAVFFGVPEGEPLTTWVEPQDC